ncbi:MAG: O-antigen ligase family protein [Candidatus Omnitrophota bacterium]
MRGIKLFLTLTSALVVAMGLLKVFDRFSHPFVLLSIVFMFFIFMLAALALRKKHLLLYPVLFAFPVMELRFPDVSVFAFILIPVALIFSNELGKFISKKWDWRYAIPLMIFLGIFIFTTLTAPYKFEAIRHASFFIPAILLYLVLCSMMKTVKDFEMLWCSMILMCSFAVAISVIQLIFGINAVKFFFFEYNVNVDMYGAARRIPSMFSDAQVAGQYFAVMALALSAYATLGFKWARYAKLLAFGVIACQLLTISRSATFGLVLGWAFVKFLSGAQRLIFMILLFGVIILLLKEPIYEHLPDSIKLRFNPVQQTEDARFRMRIWEDSYPIIEHYPLFGVGFGGLNVFKAGDDIGVKFFRVFADNPKNRKYTHFENSYLDFLCSVGVVGFGALVWLMGIFFIQAIRSLPSLPLRNTLAVKCLLGALFAWILPCGTSPLLAQSQPTMVLAVVMASIYFLIQYSKEDQ